MDSWPLPSNYAGMLQRPDIAFKDAELKKCRIKRDGQGQPLGFPGAYAIVYKAELPGGDYRAIRAFIKKVDEPKDRYSKISDHLSRVQVGCLVNFKYLDKGIRSDDGRYYPLVTMDWVSGSTLFEWLKARCLKKDGGAIRKLAERWVQMLEDMAKANIAHGDLQHANVMVTDAGDLRLVDYDCMCVPSLVGRKNLELGVLPYQHPGRNEDTLLSLEIDNFSAIVIYLALRALAVEPQLWDEFVEKTNHDKILFRTEDFKEPGKSDLLPRLKKSPDPDVPRILQEMLKLYGGKIADVPRLTPMLFSFDHVRALLSQKKFDEALDVVRRKPQQIPIPADLSPLLRNAEERVECRARLEEKVAAGDENAMTRLYRPDLLDDYPAARAAVDVAKLAPAALKAIQELQPALQRQDVREFVKLWTKHRGLLQSRKSAARFAAEFPKFQRRNELADAILKQLTSAQRNAAALAQDWRDLQQLGGHPDVAGRAKEIEGAVERGTAWEQFLKSDPGGAASEDRDRRLIGAWNDALFAGWSTADPYRSAIDDARRNLQAIGRLEQSVRTATTQPSAAAERQVAADAAGLAASYSYRLHDRVRAAQVKLDTLARFQTALRNNVPEADLAASGEALQKADGAALVGPADWQRVDLARKRIPLLQRLARLDRRSSLVQLDQALLSIWNPALLDTAPEAASWKDAQRQAVYRADLLARLEALVNAPVRDDWKAAELANDPSLQFYSLPPRIEEAVRDARKNLQAVEQLTNALRSGDPQAITRAYSRSLIARFPQVFAPLSNELEEFTHRCLSEPAVLRMSLPIGRPAVDQNNPGKLRLRWNFPDPNYCDKCLVTFTRERPTDESVIARSVAQFLVERSVCEEGFSIPDSPQWRGAYVAVWAQLTAGSKSIYSKPLLLGRISLPPESQSRSSWTDRWFGDGS